MSAQDQFFKETRNIHESSSCKERDVFTSNAPKCEVGRQSETFDKELAENNRRQKYLGNSVGLQKVILVSNNTIRGSKKQKDERKTIDFSESRHRETEENS